MLVILCYYLLLLLKVAHKREHSHIWDKVGKWESANGTNWTMYDLNKCYIRYYHLMYCNCSTYPVRQTCDQYSIDSSIILSAPIAHIAIPCSACHIRSYLCGWFARTYVLIHFLFFIALLHLERALYIIHEKNHYVSIFILYFYGNSHTTNLHIYKCVIFFSLYIPLHVYNTFIFFMKIKVLWIILVFISSIFPFWIATYHCLQLMEYIFHNSSDMLELVQNMLILLIVAKF